MRRCPTPEQRERATDAFRAHQLNDEVISVEPIEPVGLLSCDHCGYAAQLPLKMIGWTCNQRRPEQTLLEGCEGRLMYNPPALPS